MFMHYEKINVYAYKSAIHLINKNNTYSRIVYSHIKYNVVIINVKT